MIWLNLERDFEVQVGGLAKPKTVHGLVEKTFRAMVGVLK